MLLPLQMIGSGQKVGKSSLFAKFGVLLWSCGSFERFWASFEAKWGKLLLKAQVQPVRGYPCPLMQSLQEGAVARLGFCGACLTETETSRRQASFHMFFLA